MNYTKLSHLKYLESESIFIIRESYSNAKNPVLLFSIGKDSSTLLHLAKKAFYPNPIPFPLLHVDTTWKFQDMYKMREKLKKNKNIQLICFKNPNAVKRNINPFDHPKLHTEIWKTEGLKMALNKYKFDVSIAGARRDEEITRAKERVFSIRSKNHIWDPKNQRPEFWSLYNTLKDDNESLRVFPLSNWTEHDIWEYIMLEKIIISDLYFSKKRPTVKRNNQIFMVDDARFRLSNGEKPILRDIRFRTLGCYPLTAAIESKAKSLKDVINETLTLNYSERDGRLIDKEDNATLETKKRQGYF